MNLHHEFRFPRPKDMLTLKELLVEFGGVFGRDFFWPS